MAFQAPPLNLKAALITGIGETNAVILREKYIAMPSEAKIFPRGMVRFA